MSEREPPEVETVKTETNCWKPSRVGVVGAAA